MSGSHLVDVVIAVHDPRRRLDRALASLQEAASRIRVTVVCHGLPVSEVSGQLPADSHGWVRVVEFADGIASPAGPFNHGLAMATAEYVMIMGSDDFLEPGAMSAWLIVARRDGADIQLAPLRHQNGELLPNPLARPWRRRDLDPVRDRLFHRTAPLGLIRRDPGRDSHPLSERMPVGEDLAWSSALWTSGRHIGFDPGLPAYVIGSDADERTTGLLRAVDVVLAPVDALLAGDWAAHQPAAVRSSLVSKLLRVNIVGALRARQTVADWPASARRAIASTIATLEGYAPHGFDDLPRSSRDLIDVAARPDATPDEIVAAVASEQAAGRADRLLPRRVTRSFGRESVLRRYARYTLDRRR